MSEIVVRSQDYAVVREALYRSRVRMPLAKLAAATGLAERVIQRELKHLVRDGRAVVTPKTVDLPECYIHEYWARHAGMLIPKPRAKPPAKKPPARTPPAKTTKKGKR